MAARAVGVAEVAAAVGKNKLHTSTLKIILYLAVFIV